eukprot:scaffold23183_cov81-Skeletonema_dohrnii-CCMP3373.AAC.3
MQASASASAGKFEFEDAESMDIVGELRNIWIWENRDPIRLPLRRHGVGIYSILQLLIRYGTAYSYSLRENDQRSKVFCLTLRLICQSVAL